MPSLSIIIPVYNIEKYLSKCMDSILCQRYTDYEIILVDDGSTDKSGIICDGYKNKHQNIFVLHKPNGGLSSARNAGLDAAKGDYILFFDGDDMLPDNCLVKIMPQVIKKAADITICGQNTSHDNFKTLSFEKFEFTKDYYTNYLDVLADIYKSSGYGLWSVCRMIYRRSFIENSGVLFNETLKSTEDFEFNMKIFKMASSFYLIKIPILNYRINREFSLSSSRSISFYKTTFALVSKWINFYLNHSDKKRAKIIASTLSDYYFCEIPEVFYIKDKKSRIELLKLLSKNRFVMLHVKNPKKRITALFFYIFGFKIGGAVYKLLQKGIKK